MAEGVNHKIFLTLDGYVYTLGDGDSGQLGNGKITNSKVSTLVKKENTEYLTDITNISAGNKTSIAVDINGKAYVWGDNTNKKLGIDALKTSYAEQITKMQDKEGKELNLSKIENIETGYNHSSISDRDGYVYSVGVNTNGELGTEDNVNRQIFTRIGRVEIKTRPDPVKVPVGTSKDIIIALGNTFNLKTDIVKGTELELINTNEKEVTIQEIAGVNNSDITNINDFKENYTLTGQKIGRVNITAKSKEGYSKNIWVTVTNEEDAKVAAKVVNGDGFTVTLRENGSVFAFGSINGKNNPEKIEVEEEIIDISSGKSHVLLLGKSGTVYSFGTNGNGQLGTGNTSTYKVPVKINIKEIEKVQAHGNTSFAITRNRNSICLGRRIQ